jgi:hypothetical protein
MVKIPKQKDLSGALAAKAKAKARDPFTAESLVEFQRLYLVKFGCKAGNDIIWEFYDQKPEIYHQDQGEPYACVIAREKKYNLKKRD